MNEGRWIRVTLVENVPPREGRAVLVGGQELALFNLGDRFLATDPNCPVGPVRPAAALLTMETHRQRIPMWWAAMTSRTVDIPVMSPPSRRSIRTSAGVS